MTGFARLMCFLWAFALFYVSFVPGYYVRIGSVSPVISLLFKYIPFLTLCLIYLVVLYRFISNRSSGNLRGKLSRTIEDRLELYVALYVTSCTISVLNAPIDRTLEDFARLIYYSATGIFILSSIRALDLAHRADLTVFLSRLIPIFGGILALYGTFSYLSGSDWVFHKDYGYNTIFYNGVFWQSNTVRAYSTFGNPIPYATFLMMTFPFGWFNFTIAKGFAWKSVWLFVSLLIIIGIFFSYSRGAYIALLMGVVLLLLKWRVSLYTKCSVAISVVVFLCISYGAINENSISHIERFQHRVEQLKNINETESERIYRYNMTYELLQTYPYTGVGFGNLVDNFEKFISKVDYGIARTTDNLYLMILCETGMLGMVCFMLLISQILLAFLKKPSRDVTTFSYCCLVAVAMALVNAMTWDNLNHVAIRVLFWLIVALGLEDKKKDKKNEQEL